MMNQHIRDYILEIMFSEKTSQIHQEDENANQDTITRENQTSPQLSSGVNWKALRHDPKSRRSPLGGDMKPEASALSSNKSEETDLQPTRSTPRYRSVRRQTSEDEAGKVRTTTYLKQITESNDSDDSDKIKPRVKRRRRQPLKE